MAAKKGTKPGSVKGEIPDPIFWEILAKNYGLYAKTARAIQQRFKISYTRQAVKQRAEKDKDRLQAIREEWIEAADQAVRETLDGGIGTERLRAAEIIYKLHKQPGFTQAGVSAQVTTESEAGVLKMPTTTLKILVAGDPE